MAMHACGADFDEQYCAPSHGSSRDCRIRSAMVRQVIMNKSEDRDASKGASGTTSLENQRASIGRRIFQPCADRDGRLGLLHRALAGEIVPLVLQLTRAAGHFACTAAKKIFGMTRIIGAH